MGIQCIFGPPGTGKTTALMDEVEALMAKEVPSTEIAFVSFTRVAIQTAKDRITARFPNLDPDEAFPFFRTIHSMARSLSADGSNAKTMEPRHWKDFGESCSYTFSKEEPDEDLLAYSILETDADALRQIHSLMRLCRCSPEQAMLRVRQRPMHLTVEHLAIFGARLAAFKKEHNLVDYTDMLERALASHRLPSVRYAFIDEAQDLCRLQTELAEKWFFRNERCVETVVAGDDDQAIFTFAGGHPEWLIDLAGRYPSRVLPQSYRIPAIVHPVAQSIIRDVPNRVPKVYRPRDARGEIISCRTPRDALAFAGDGSLVVIARNGGLLATYRDAFIESALLFTSRAGMKPPLEHRQCRAAFHAVANLRRGVAVHAPDFVDLLHFVPSTAADGRTILPRGTKTKALANRLPVTLGRARDEFGAALIVEELLHRDNPFEALPRFAEEERRYLGRILARHPTGVLPDPKVTLSTIHRFKGDEADTVILLPDMYGASYSEFLNGDRAGEHRCAYVAITRMRSRLVLMLPQRPRCFYPYAHHVQLAAA